MNTTIGFLLGAGVILALLFLGARSGLLRDANSIADGLARPFSLSRVQGAWWFAIVFISYLHFWLKTNAFPELNQTALVLLGISGGTGLIAAGIDSAPKRAMPATSGFFADILTDANGITLARLQLLVWNVTLGILYLIDVFQPEKAVFPLFTETTLGLLGLSATAYVGGKVPEKHTAPEEVALSPDNSKDPKAAYQPSGDSK